jgi:hypothetical protein
MEYKQNKIYTHSERYNIFISHFINPNLICKYIKIVKSNSVAEVQTPTHPLVCMSINDYCCFVYLPKSYCYNSQNHVNLITHSYKYAIL